MAPACTTRKNGASNRSGSPAFMRNANGSVVTSVAPSANADAQNSEVDITNPASANTTASPTSRI